MPLPSIKWRRFLPAYGPACWGLNKSEEATTFLTWEVIHYLPPNLSIAFRKLLVWRCRCEKYLKDRLWPLPRRILSNSDALGALQFCRQSKRQNETSHCLFRLRNDVSGSWTSSLPIATT